MAEDAFVDASSVLGRATNVYRVLLAAVFAGEGGEVVIGGSGNPASGPASTGPSMAPDPLCSLGNGILINLMLYLVCGLITWSDVVLL